jgi:hypothetical protein
MDVAMSKCARVAWVFAVATLASACGWNASCHSWWFFEGRLCADPDASRDAGLRDVVMDGPQQGCFVPQVCSAGGCRTTEVGYVWNGTRCVRMEFACRCSGDPGCLFVLPTLEGCETSRLRCNTFTRSGPACSSESVCDTDAGDACVSSCASGLQCDPLGNPPDASQCVETVVVPPCM